VVIGFSSFEGAVFTIARQIADFDFGFAVNREPQGLRIGISTLIGLGNIVEDGIGLSDFL
jgi:hypothetical protein